MAQMISPFVRAALEQQLEADGLTVLGEGLGLSKLLAACVRLHAAQGGGLVLLLGFVDWQKRSLLHDVAAACDGTPPPGM